MALVTRRNPETDELETYWDPNFRIEPATSDAAYQAGKRIRNHMVERRVSFYDLGQHLGKGSVYASDLCRGLFEIPEELERDMHALIDELAEKEADHV